MSRTWPVLVLSMAPVAAVAQSEARFSVGPGVTFVESTGKFRLTPAVRGRRSGFGPTLGFNWHTTEVDRGPGGLTARGELRVRPLMAGLAYATVRGRLATTAGVVGGYSFNRISSTAPAAGPHVDLQVGNSLAWAPMVAVGLDLNHKVGLLAQASYLVTRPQVTARSAGVVDRWRFEADTLVVQLGVVFGLF